MKNFSLVFFVFICPLRIFANLTNCQVVRKQIEAHQQAVFSPRIFSQLNKGPHGLPGQIDEGNPTSYRLGLELDLLQWISKKSDADYSDSECARLEHQDQFDKALLDIPLILEQEGWKAQKLWLEVKHQEIQQEIYQVQKQWDAHMVSMLELWQRKKWLTFIQLKQHEVEQSLEKLPKDVIWMTAPQLEALKNSLTETTVKSLMEQENRLIPQPWHLSIQTGGEFRTSSRGQIESQKAFPYFASLELSYALFAPSSSNSRMNGLEIAYRDNLETNKQNPHGKFLTLKENLQHESTNKKGRLGIIQKYLQEVNEMSKVVNPKTEGSQNFSFQLQQEKFTNELETIYLKTQVEKIENFFAEQAKVAPVATSFVLENVDAITTLGNLTLTPHGKYATTSSKLRTKLQSHEGSHLKARFLYQGPTEEISALASGRIREQFGFFLRALNQCNGLYVMIRLGPKIQIAVQSKINPGESTHAGCEANGYNTLQPTFTRSPTRQIGPGDSCLLGSIIKDDQLRVYFDQELVWQGQVPSALPNPGYAGIRSDNVKIEFEILKDESRHGT